MTSLDRFPSIPETLDVRKSLGLYYRTVRHLRSSQIFGRINRAIRLASERLPFVLSRFGNSSEIRFDELTPIQKPIAYVSRQSYFGNNTFEFLNKRIETGQTWFPPDTSLLWRFHLRCERKSTRKRPEELQSPFSDQQTACRSLLGVKIPTLSRSDPPVAGGDGCVFRSILPGQSGDIVETE